MGETHNRKLNRLKNYDYSERGYYFITICTKNHEELFGKIANGHMVLNKYGIIANDCWASIVNHFINIELDKFCIMPNHIHGIIVIRGSNLVVGSNERCSLHQMCENRNIELIPKIISQYKSSVTRISKLSSNSFAWQKSYYDHIIRNEKSLNMIRRYIDNNPRKWGGNSDEEHTENIVDF